MATLIRIKRKKSSGNNSVKLNSGEPYYNLSDKKLYIGNESESDSLRGKRHIAEIQEQDASGQQDLNNYLDGGPTVSFTIGEATDNTFYKTVNNVNIAKGLVLDNMFYGTETDRNNLKNKLGTVPDGTVFFQETE